MEQVSIALLSFLQNFCVVLVAFELLLCRHLPKRSHFPLRLLAVAAFIFIFCKESSPFMPWREYGLFTKIPFLSVGGIMNFGFVIVFFCSVLVMMLCFRASFIRLLALCAAAYLGQNVTFHFNLFFRHLLFGGSNEGLGYRLFSLLTIAAVMACLYLFLVRRLKRSPDVACDYRFSLAFTFIMLIMVSLFSYWIYYTDEYSYLLGIFILLCDCLLLVLFYSAFLRAKTDAEKRRMEQMLQKGEWQYETYKQNIDLINRKCHDLKHEIAVLRGISDNAERESYITELENAIMFYDTKIKTGNEVIDILLSEKSMRCKEKGIEFSCIADGSALAFMAPADLSVLFGNAVDNAIEAELAEPEGERRISVNVARKDALVTVAVENYFSGRIESGKDGLPATSKQDKAEHGFGLKSIRFIAQKYGGAMQAVHEGDRFRLLCVFDAAEADARAKRQQK